MASLNGKEFKELNGSRVYVTDLEETKTLEKNSQNDSKTSVIMKECKTSKYESFCKILAVAIVVIAFVFHLLRGGKEGRVLFIFLRIDMFHYIVYILLRT